MRGIHTQEEILSQPRCWSECWRALEDNGHLGQVARQLGVAPEWIFIGCGSSYYVAQAAAASAIPASASNKPLARRRGPPAERSNRYIARILT